MSTHVYQKSMCICISRPMQARKKASKPNVKKEETNDLVLGSVKDFSYALELTHDSKSKFLHHGRKSAKDQTVALPKKTLRCRQQEDGRSSSSFIYACDGVQINGHG